MRWGGHTCPGSWTEVIDYFDFHFFYNTLYDWLSFTEGWQDFFRGTPTLFSDFNYLDAMSGCQGSRAGKCVDPNPIVLCS